MHHKYVVRDGQRRVDRLDELDGRRVLARGERDRARDRLAGDGRELHAELRAALGARATRVERRRGPAGDARSRRRACEPLFSPHGPSLAHRSAERIAAARSSPADPLPGASRRERCSARSRRSRDAPRSISWARTTRRRCARWSGSGRRGRRTTGRSPPGTPSSPRLSGQGHPRRGAPTGGVHDFMHAKVVVADGEVLTGSYNLSHGGEENAENVLHIRSGALAERFGAFVERVAARYAASGLGILVRRMRSPVDMRASPWRSAPRQGTTARGANGAPRLPHPGPVRVCVPLDTVSTVRRTLAAVFALGAVSCSIASGVTPSQPPPQSPPALGTAGCPSRGSDAARHAHALPSRWVRPPGAVRVPLRHRRAHRSSSVRPGRGISGAVHRRTVRRAPRRPPDDAFPLGDGADMQVYGCGRRPRPSSTSERTRAFEMAPTATSRRRGPADRLRDRRFHRRRRGPVHRGGPPELVDRLRHPHRTRHELRHHRGRVTGRRTARTWWSSSSGTNDADPVAFRENRVTILDLLRRVPLVVWQTAHGPLANIPGVNIHVHGAVSTYANTLVADWDTFVSRRRAVVGRRASRAGHEDLMAKLVAPILTRWLEVCRPECGATSCAAQAETRRRRAVS